MGLFDDSSPNIIYLDIDMVTTMEATTPGSLMGDAFSFWVGTTILHEFVHYGDGVNGNGEEEVLFEDEVYGQNVSRKNAVEVLLQGSKSY